MNELSPCNTTPSTLPRHVIDNFMEILDTNVRKRQVFIKSYLKAALVEEWSKITPEDTHKFY